MADAQSVRVLEIKQGIFEHNDRKADKLRERLHNQGIYLLNLMSSPGSGKTTTLLATIKALRNECSIAVMEADIDSDVDARTIAQVGVPSIQLHTGGMCHLDAAMTEQGLDGLLKVAGAESAEFAAGPSVHPTATPDLVILENVGNLVCPAEFDTGATANAMIWSVPEGDDKALKYPLMFSVCDVVLINKIDTLSVFDDFDLDFAIHSVHQRNPNATVIPISAKTGEGIDVWAEWLRADMERVKSL